jgi:TatD DNase family protein
MTPMEPTNVIDAHIHLDLYDEPEREALLQSLIATSVATTPAPVDTPATSAAGTPISTLGDAPTTSASAPVSTSGITPAPAAAPATIRVAGLIAVSMHESSCRANLELQRHFPQIIYPAFGFHPEQPLPDPSELERLFTWIRAHNKDAIAIGEVGLPYYTRTEASQLGRPFNHAPYVALLERFVELAAELDKPIVLHAVYEDAHVACDLLEKHGVTRAHFHWFKGDAEVAARMIHNGYSISVTPDALYESEIQQLVTVFPLHRIMTETDGPWLFEGPFTGQVTHPRMISATIRKIAELKQIPEQVAAEVLFRNACIFYEIPFEFSRS